MTPFKPTMSAQFNLEYARDLGMRYAELDQIVESAINDYLARVEQNPDEATPAPKLSAEREEMLEIKERNSRQKLERHLRDLSR